MSGVQWGAWQTNSIAAAIPKEQRYDQDLSVHVVIHTFVLLDKASWGHASLFWDILDTSGWICFIAGNVHTWLMQGQGLERNSVLIRKAF